MIVLAILIPVIIHVVKQLNQNLSLTVSRTTRISTTWIMLSSAITATSRLITITSTSTSSTSTTAQTTTSSTTIILPSIYSSMITNYSSRCCLETCYTLDRANFYETIQINISISGIYTFRSVSNMDTYGAIYNHSYNPTSWTTNLLSSNDDNDVSNEFIVNVSLEREIRYVLVVMIAQTYATGSFSIIANGPSFVTFNRINTSGVCSITESIYTSELKMTSSIFCRALIDCEIPTYYYQAIQIGISTSGNYMIKSISNISTLGYIYTNTFDYRLPNANLLTLSFDSIDNQFRYNIFLGKDTQKILVLTTLETNTIGSFSIHAIGPGLLNFTRIDISPNYTVLESNYSSELTDSSLHGCFFSLCQVTYEPLLLDVIVSGDYTVRSRSHFDTYGFLYRNTYSSSNWTGNLLAMDDDSGGHFQFMITSYLQTGIRYILITAVLQPNFVGPFSISAIGPAQLGFARTNMTDNPIIPNAPSNLVDYRNYIGQNFTFRVTGDNTGSIWGTLIYTDDSNIATAAVHSGFVSYRQTMIIKVMILSGQTSYIGSIQNGITSQSWSSWYGSYRILFSSTDYRMHIT